MNIEFINIIESLLYIVSRQRCEFYYLDVGLKKELYQLLF